MPYKNLRHEAEVHSSAATPRGFGIFKYHCRHFIEVGNILNERVSVLQLRQQNFARTFKTPLQKEMNTRRKTFSKKLGCNGRN